MSAIHKENNPDKHIVAQKDFHDWSLLAAPLLSWYQANARTLPWRETRDPYRIWVSEIMLQQTRVEAVRGYYDRFMEELPDVKALASCPEDRLLKLWEGLGYYSRARNLKKAAMQIMEQHGGRLPADHAKLLKLSGIGPYTAGAIASIAFDLPYPAIDGNVLRVRARAFGDEADIAEQKTKKETESELLSFLQKSSVSPGAFNQALMDLGATVCLPNGTPLCEDCPWQTLCIANRDNLTALLPVRAKKKARRIEKRTVFLIMDGERIVLQKRPAKGLLAGLYELPNLPGHLTGEEALATVRDMGLHPLRIQTLTPAKHIFTHIEWHMTGFLIRVDSLTSESAGLLFAEQKDVRERYSIPSAFDAYIRHTKKSGD